MKTTSVTPGEARAIAREAYIYSFPLRWFHEERQQQRQFLQCEAEQRRHVHRVFRIGRDLRRCAQQVGYYGRMELPDANLLPGQVGFGGGL